MIRRQKLMMDPECDPALGTVIAVDAALPDGLDVPTEGTVGHLDRGPGLGDLKAFDAVLDYEDQSPSFVLKPVRAPPCLKK